MAKRRTKSNVLNEMKPHEVTTQDPAANHTDEHYDQMIIRARSSQSSSYGGHVAELPSGPRVRRWPASRYCCDTSAFPTSTRPLHVKITSFIGSAPGASHYKLRVEEEDNPVWDDDKLTWRKAWDDTEAIDCASVEACLRSKDAAVALAIESLIAIAGKEAAVRPLLWGLGEDCPTDIADRIKSEVARRFPKS